MTDFGLQINSFTFGGPEEEIFDRTAELARAAEESGYRSLWVMDHLYQLDSLGGPDQPMLEAYTLLGALAAVTSRVSLGTMVSGVTYRNPALLAKIITTLDVISHGRAVCGLGAAWHEPEHLGHGYEYPPVGRRIDRLEEALQICRAMFDGDGASFSGRYYKIENVRTVPRPVQERIPILIGGGGEKRTLRLVAKYGDASNIVGGPDEIRHKRAIIDQHCEDVGRDPSEIRMTVLGVLMFTDTQEEADQRRDMVRQIAGDRFANSLLVGTDETIREQVEAAAEAGADEVIFSMPGAGPDEVRAAGSALAGVA